MLDSSLKRTEKVGIAGRLGRLDELTGRLDALESELDAFLASRR